MGQIKKKTSVKGIVPAEVVAASLKEDDPAVALYNALSINVKPENETEEERKIRLMRRQFMFNIFGASADELEEILKKNKQVHEERGSGKSDLDLLRDSEDVARGQEASNASNKIQERFDDVGKVASWGGTALTAAGSFGIETAAITVATISLPLTTIIGVGAALLGITATVVSKVMKRKIKKGNKADANEKNRAYEEMLETFAKKIEIINEILTQKMDEIMEKKKTLSPKDFTEYKKGLIEEIKKHMKSIGLEIVTKNVDNTVKEEIEEEKPEKPKQEKKGKEEKPEKEGENPEKDENAEERGAE